MATLYEKLKKYGQEDICPMHMPGHKRKRGICAELDITEIDGFDNLANPTGILKEIADKGAKLYGADKAFLSVNGSTGTILSAICAVCKRGDKIIMARNCHKSVYNAAELMELNVSYIFPKYDENGIAKAINPHDVEMAIEENPDAKLLVLTSPTYEGVISDIKSISDIAHGRNIPVFVDSAHGAHLKFMGLPTPVDCGADISAVSLHKTLPAMTQTALLLTKGERVNEAAVREKINTFQTSSPSYVLMASIGECFEFLEEADFKEYEKNLDEFYKLSENLTNIKIMANDDKGKIIILTNGTNISGRELMDILREKYKIELEMAYDCYALAMTSVCDEKEDLKRLCKAILEIDKELFKCQKMVIKYPKPQKASVDKELETEFVSFKESENRICADFIWGYPPGVPIIARGEIIDRETLGYILKLKKTALYGKYGSDENKILVIK